MVFVTRKKKQKKKKLDKTKDSSVNKLRRTPPRLSGVQGIVDTGNKTTHRETPKISWKKGNR